MVNELWQLLNNYFTLNVCTYVCIYSNPYPLKRVIVYAFILILGDEKGTHLKYNVKFNLILILQKIAICVFRSCLVFEIS